MEYLRKGNLLGKLTVVNVEVRLTKKIKNVERLTIVSDAGDFLTPCEYFKKVSYKKALEHFLSVGWKVVE